MKKDIVFIFIIFSAVLVLISTSTAIAYDGAYDRAANTKPEFCRSQNDKAQTDVSTPSCGSTPTAVFDHSELLNVVYVDADQIKFTTSGDLGKTFSNAISVTPVPEKIYADGENRPKIALGKQGQIYVSWVHETEGRYTGDIRFSRSLDQGKSFSIPITVNDDGLLTSHRFDSMLVGPDGRIHMTWLDKRDLLAAKKLGQEYVGAALYYAVSDNAGLSFSKNKKVVDNSCECCRISLKLNHQGQPIAFWRHVFEGGARDHAISNLDLLSDSQNDHQGDQQSGQETTLNHQRVTFDNWKIDACPHHGPDMGIDSEDRLHMFWFTGRSDKGGLFYGRFDQKKEQGKKNLEHQINISASPAASRPQVLVKGERVFLTWKIFEDKQTKLQMKISEDSGENWTDTITLATSEGHSDHPLIIEHGDTPFISWWTGKEGFRLIPLMPMRGDPLIKLSTKSSIYKVSEGHSVTKVRAFEEGSMQQIEKSNINSEFLFVLWSVECPPCFRELEILAENYQTEGFPKLILISTDGPEFLPEIKSVLNKYGLLTDPLNDLADVENWHFNGITEQLRAMIDPSWFGEIPRSYFYAKNGSRSSHSGVLTQEILNTWFSFRMSQL